MSTVIIMAGAAAALVIAVSEGAVTVLVVTVTEGVLDPPAAWAVTICFVSIFKVNWALWRSLLLKLGWSLLVT